MLAPEEEEFPFRRPARFRNLEKLDQRLLVDPAAMRKAYLEKFHAFRESLTERIRVMGADYHRAVDGRALGSDDRRLPGHPHKPGPLRVATGPGRCDLSWGVMHWGMLAGLGGVAIPVVIHLLNRRRTTVVDWCAMQFLELGRRAQIRFQLSELLLLAGRMALLAIVALALARPFWTANQPQARAADGAGERGFFGGPRPTSCSSSMAPAPWAGEPGKRRPETGARMGPPVDREARRGRLGRRAGCERSGNARGHTSQL